LNHQNHLNLLRGGVPGSGGVWADLGSGSGAFTLALADLIGPEGEIYSVDRDEGALRRQEREMSVRFPGVKAHYLSSDFTRRLNLPPLDGIVMANALHFIQDKPPVLDLVRSYLRDGGRLILVEYNSDRGNPWVPHPISYGSWESLAAGSGFASTQLLARVPSRFLGEIYSAVSR
jgi:ubiquinone/menaquinone biosynthesis C-methylase UbiE